MKSSAKNFLLCFPQHNMASKLPLCFLCLCNCTFIQKICQHHTCSSRVRLATFKSVMLGTLTACFSILRKYASHSSSRCFLNVCIVSFSSLLHSLLTCVINNMVIIMYVYIQTALEPWCLWRQYRGEREFTGVMHNYCISSIRHCDCYFITAHFLCSYNSRATTIWHLFPMTPG